MKLPLIAIFKVLFCCVCRFADFSHASQVIRLIEPNWTEFKPVGVDLDRLSELGAFVGHLIVVFG